MIIQWKTGASGGCCPYRKKRFDDTYGRRMSGAEIKDEDGQHGRQDKRDIEMASGTESGIKTDGVICEF